MDKLKKLLLLLLLLLKISPSDCDLILSFLSKPKFVAPLLFIPFLNENVHASDNTLVGDPIMLIFASSCNILGGSSRLLAGGVNVDLGFPGASSHWNGIEADGRSGGVCMCRSLALQNGSLDSVSLGVEFGSLSSSALKPMSLAHPREC